MLSARRAESRAAESHQSNAQNYSLRLVAFTLTAPLRYLRLVGPNQSRFRRIAVAIVVLGVAAGIGAWQAYGRYHLLVGTRSLQSHHYGEALGHFQTALKVWPEDGGTSLLAARAARGTGNYEAADRYLRICQMLPSQADQAAFERVLLRTSKGEIDAVGQFCHAMVEQGHPETPSILEALAVGNLTLLRFAAASEALDRWLEIAPDQPQAIFLKGRLHLQASNNVEALEYLRRVVELDAERDDARLLLAGLHLDLGQAQEALPHLETASRRQPGNVPARARLAQAMILLGRTEEAVVILDDVLQRRPDLASALLERGKLALREGQLEQAEDWLRQACQRDPGDRAASYQLLQCLKQRGKTKDALVVQQRLDQIDHDATRMHQIVTVELPQRRFDPELQAELGELLLSLGADNEGLVWLNRALQFDPRLPRAHRALAGHYQSLGQSSLAQQHLAYTGAGDAQPAASD